LGLFCQRPQLNCTVYRFRMSVLNFLKSWLTTKYAMGWLRLVGSLKLYVSFAEYRHFYRALLQKRPIILRRLLIVATPPYTQGLCWIVRLFSNTYMYVHVSPPKYTYIHISVYRPKYTYPHICIYEIYIEIYIGISLNTHFSRSGMPIIEILQISTLPNIRYIMTSVLYKNSQRSTT